MIEHSPDITKLATAMHAAQQQLTGVKKDSTNPHFRNRYASLEAVIDTARGPLNAAGIWFVQAPGRYMDGALEITTMLTHAESGQWLRSTLSVPLAKVDPQGAGSAITYGCRYALMATLGLPPVDDDAEAAVGRPAQNSAPARPTTKATNKGEQEFYVTNAIQSLRQIKVEKDLKAWWAAEKANRDRLGLDASVGPGLVLMEAYGDHKAALQSETMAA